MGNVAAYAFIRDLIFWAFFKKKCKLYIVVVIFKHKVIIANYDLKYFIRFVSNNTYLKNNVSVSMEGMILLIFIPTHFLYYSTR